MKRPAPPPPERETVSRVPTFEGREVPKDLPFPPGAWVHTTWAYVGGRILVDGTEDGRGTWEAQLQRVATQEEIDAHQGEWRRAAAAATRPFEAAEPAAAEVQALLGRLAAAPPAPVRRGPTEEERAAEVRRKRLWYARRAGVPADIVEALRAPQDRPALMDVRAWAAGDKRALLLHGANQAGKSVAAAAWLSKHERGRWAAADEIGLATQPDPENRGAAWLRQLRGAAALVVDNVGARCGPAGYEEIEALVMHHLAAGRRLVITTDLSPEDFFRHFGEVTTGGGDPLAGKPCRSRLLSRWRLVGAVAAVEPYGQLELRSA